ncbi:UspA domain protein (plasmid) [Natrialba magadii ATCC 43099]|uniref:UspA domain protein n=1 Tax=Natrialba magadii (strain ATCC 43099 / DSM 3394 / CCM 3739 / CIP 104546 / IAM 13178 / JCM 8861 / NBRC 102185 / NCIMB 2190 / MS3) TaxID=547559 RepID=D3T113_NATMM|nr:universal stress protein [Natrialba magadii]ADD07272.1 UspA domain protein [Natrialba magadii ATCC 43099]ELY34381.1 UspA domain-containing protein [Natrialba magadii ATCC 43099]
MGANTTTTEETLLVPVANEETATRLMDTATDIATERSLRILVIYVVAVPDQLPLDAGDRLLEDDDEQMLADAAATAAEHDIPVDQRVRFARSVTSGILGAIEKEPVELTLLGWRGRPPRQNVILGSYIDTVLRKATCDVLVKRIQTPQPTVDSILMPVAGGPHDGLALEMAAAIASKHDATVHLLHVRAETEPERSETAARELLRDAAREFESGTDLHRTVVVDDHVAGAITDRTVDHDITLLGVSRGGVIQRAVLGTISEAVGRHASGTVFLAKRYDPVPSRLQRLIRRPFR